MAFLSWCSCCVMRAWLSFFKLLKYRYADLVYAFYIVELYNKIYVHLRYVVTVTFRARLHVHWHCTRIENIWRWKESYYRLNEIVWKEKEMVAYILYTNQIKGKKRQTKSTSSIRIEQWKVNSEVRSASSFATCLWRPCCFEHLRLRINRLQAKIEE